MTQRRRDSGTERQSDIETEVQRDRDTETQRQGYIEIGGEIDRVTQNGANFANLNYDQKPTYKWKLGFCALS